VSALEHSPPPPPAPRASEREGGGGGGNEVKGANASSFAVEGGRDMGMYPYVRPGMRFMLFTFD
jgi:hypothetical protein